MVRYIRDCVVHKHTLSLPAFLTAVCALLRTYRLASVLALVAGLVSVVDGYYLIRATAPSKGWSFNLVDILDIVLFGTKVASRIAIPIGIALIVGGILGGCPSVFALPIAYRC